jgi:hypothetical protein
MTLVKGMTVAPKVSRFGCGSLKDRSIVVSSMEGLARGARETALRHSNDPRWLAGNVMISGWQGSWSAPSTEWFAPKPYRCRD